MEGGQRPVCKRILSSHMLRSTITQKREACALHKSISMKVTIRMKDRLSLNPEGMFKRGEGKRRNLKTWILLLGQRENSNRAF